MENIEALIKRIKLNFPGREREIDQEVDKMVAQVTIDKFASLSDKELANLVRGIKDGDPQVRGQVTQEEESAVFLELTKRRGEGK